MTVDFHSKHILWVIGLLIGVLNVVENNNFSQHENGEAMTTADSFHKVDLFIPTSHVPLPAQQGDGGFGGFFPENSPLNEENGHDFFSPRSSPTFSQQHSRLPRHNPSFDNLGGFPLYDPFASTLSHSPTGHHQQQNHLHPKPSEMSVVDKFLADLEGEVYEKSPPQSHTGGRPKTHAGDGQNRKAASPRQQRSDYSSGESYSSGENDDYQSGNQNQKWPKSYDYSTSYDYDSERDKNQQQNNPNNQYNNQQNNYNNPRQQSNDDDFNSSEGFTSSIEEFDPSPRGGDDVGGDDGDDDESQRRFNKRNNKLNNIGLAPGQNTNPQLHQGQPQAQQLGQLFPGIFGQQQQFPQLVGAPIFPPATTAGGWNGQSANSQQPLTSTWGSNNNSPFGFTNNYNKRDTSSINSPFSRGLANTNNHVNHDKGSANSAFTTPPTHGFSKQGGGGKQSPSSGSSDYSPAYFDTFHPRTFLGPAFPPANDGPSNKNHSNPIGFTNIDAAQINAPFSPTEISNQNSPFSNQPMNLFGFDSFGAMSSAGDVISHTPKSRFARNAKDLKNSTELTLNISINNGGNVSHDEQIFLSPVASEKLSALPSDTGYHNIPSSYFSSARNVQTNSQVRKARQISETDLLSESMKGDTENIDDDVRIIQINDDSRRNADLIQSESSYSSSLVPMSSQTWMQRSGFVDQFPMASHKKKKKHSSHHEDHHAEEGHKKKKGHKKKHGKKGGKKGHHKKKEEKGSHGKKGGKKHGKKKSGHFKKGKKHGHKKKKGGKMAKKGHHKKGKKTHGFKNTYKKDEYGKYTKFHDEHEDGGHHKKYDEHHSHHEDHGGKKKKGGHHMEDHHDDHHKKGGHHKKGHWDEDHKGHHGDWGDEHHYGEKKKHGKKGGKKKSEHGGHGHG